MPFPAHFVTSVKLPISTVLEAKSGHRRAAAKEAALEEAELRGVLHPLLGQVAPVRQVRAVTAPGGALAVAEQDQQGRHVVAAEATRFGQVWGETPGGGISHRSMDNVVEKWRKPMILADLRLLRVAICIKKKKL